MRRVVLIIAVSVLLGLPSAAIAAAESEAPGSQAGPEPLPTGEVIERVICAGDPGRSYALYLPTGYAPDRRWPILLLMDPRGRALLPLALFRAAAERYGYIVASSYDTRSDSPEPVNRIAMRAILPDLEARLSVDSRRYYLAGFSGTARAAWGFGAALAERVAGVVGVGAGPPPDYRMPDRLPFVFFGTAGTGDFNYDEMRALDVALDPLDTPHRFEDFEGGHQWPDASVCGLALGWMELMAMRRGLRDRDDELIDRLHTEMMEEAEGAERAGDPYAAWVRYRAIAVDFSGLLDPTGAVARGDALGRRDDVRATQARHDEIAREHAAYQARLMSFLAGLHRPGHPPPLSRSLRILQIRELQRRAGATGDPVGAAAARRWLEHAYVLTSFYVPRDRLDESEPEFSLAALRIAGAIKPRDARLCLGEARAYAQMGKTRKALRSLRCAVESGRIDAARLDADPHLEPLRGDDRYHELLQQAAGPS